MRFLISSVFICLLFLTGCGGVRYSEEYKQVDISQHGQGEVTVRVLAQAEEWLNSGVIVRAGRQYILHAQGKWHGGPICEWTGPDGIGASSMCFFHIVPGWSISTLIAKIGENGKPFAVGSEYSFVASKDGILYFHINEPPSSCGDNQGFVTAKISSPKTVPTEIIIDVRIVGYDDGKKDSKQKDYQEAVLNAKRQAIERAGVEVKTVSRVRDFKVEEDYIESNAKAILMPGFEIIDIGYTEDGTYHILMIGKIKATAIQNQ